MIWADYDPMKYLGLDTWTEFWGWIADLTKHFRRVKEEEEYREQEELLKNYGPGGKWHREEVARDMTDVEI